MGNLFVDTKEVLRIAKECGFWGAETNSFGVSYKLERFATVIYEACAKSMQADGWRQCAKDQHTSQFCGQLEAAVAAERAVSDRLLEALKMVSLTRRIEGVEHAIKLIAEVEAMRKEKPD